ncbi:hypothetical protein [Lewinella sp. 4G2]|uniref:hypothetical protein n=1 Tax=Lewinella sp. 4G2 TaxID=1803372 RepID=UPI0007B4A309|nr:hypothetical protein [Lewinella sp. 4G2]OAV44553.1 hypothetical protein A3850_008640 [Lewinella sp. 4G2]
MLPSTFDLYWKTQGQQFIDRYASGESSWIVGLPPEAAVRMPLPQLLGILRQRLGEETLSNCLDPDQTFPSPVAEEKNGDWLRQTNTVGVNVRTIGSFLEVVKYALTLPDHIRGVHLLPIWEPGVVGSLYGMASWQLNTEFYSQELYAAGIGKLEDQLRVCVNLLHALGKVVGMDVIPHTDRYSEMVLANPDHFEWLQRWDTKIVDHRAYLHEDVQGAIYDWLIARGPAAEAYATVGHLWQLAEAKRLLLLFGHPEDYLGRQRRRTDLVDWLFRRGYEPVPATMAPPYRGIEVDSSPAAITVDAAGHAWRDYRITEPQTMSRVFGPLTRYKLYGRQNDNRDWAIDFESPRFWVWNYLTGHYARQQAAYNFDFMRGDMSHVQMRPEGVPPAAEIDDFYDPLRAVKKHIQRSAPHFAYFAESFLTPDGFMAYGSEAEHLERSEAEVTLGDLQSTIPGGSEFWERLDHYLDVAATTEVTPAWTVITGDKDDPRFDAFHHHGEVARMFAGLFLGRLSLYYSLGFAQRDRHFERAPNEVYSKLYVFQEERGDKAVSGPFRWGGNLDLFVALTKLHQFAAGILAHLGPVKILRQGPDALVWLRTASDGEGAYLLVANFAVPSETSIKVKGLGAYTSADLIFSSPTKPHALAKVTDGVLVVSLETEVSAYLLK